MVDGVMVGGVFKKMNSFTSLKIMIRNNVIISLENIALL